MFGSERCNFRFWREAEREMKPKKIYSAISKNKTFQNYFGASEGKNFGLWEETEKCLVFTPENGTGTIFRGMFSRTGRKVLQFMGWEKCRRVLKPSPWSFSRIEKKWIHEEILKYIFVAWQLWKRVESTLQHFDKNSDMCNCWNLNILKPKKLLFINTNEYFFLTPKLGSATVSHFYCREKKNLVWVQFNYKSLLLSLIFWRPYKPCYGKTQRKKISYFLFE